MGETAKAIKRAQGGVIVLIACEDITERKRAGERFGKREAFSRLIEHAYDVVVLLDRNFGLLYASPSTERSWGTRPGNWSAATVSILSILTSSKTPGAIRGSSGHPGSVYTAERLIQHKYGTWLWTRCTMTNLLGEPSVHAFVVNLRDISDRKRAEAALRKSERPRGAGVLLVV